MIAKILGNIKKNPANAAIGIFLEGLGVGIILARPIIGTHPLRWGIGLALLGAAIELYPLFFKR